MNVFRTPGNKTLHYYAKRVLRFIKQTKLSEEWHSFMEKPERERTLEKGATIVAQWFQPEHNIKWEDIAKILDDIALMVTNMSINCRYCFTRLTFR